MGIMLYLSNRDEDEIKEQYDDAAAAGIAWKDHCRDYVQGDSEYFIDGIYFDEDDTEIEFESEFFEYEWSDVMATHDELVEADEAWARV